MSAYFFRNQIVFKILNFIIKANFDWWKPLEKLFFDANNFMKNAHTVFKNISLRACAPNFKCKDASLKS